MVEGPSEHSAPAGSGEIATSTLAEIYAQQGLLGRALGIYRRMLSRSPDDAEIAARIEGLERRIEEAGEEEEARPDATAVEAPSPSLPAPRERLPWDPPEPEPAPGVPEGSSGVPEGAPAADAESPRSVGPIDRAAFEAWLAGR